MNVSCFIPINYKYVYNEQIFLSLFNTILNPQEHSFDMLNINEDMHIMY